MFKEYLIEVDYTGVDGVQKYLSNHACTLLSTDYGERVLFTVAVKKVEGEVFQAELVDYMQGKVDIIAGEEYYAPFKE